MIKIDWAELLVSGELGFQIYKSKDFSAHPPSYWAATQELFDSAPVVYKFSWSVDAAISDAIIIYRV